MLRFLLLSFFSFLFICDSCNSNSIFTKIVSTDVGVLTNSDYSLFLYLKYSFLSIIGGLILNLMPCSFPVLSIKALSVIKLVTKSERTAARLSFFGIFIGNIIFFLILSFIVSYSKYKNESFQWGFYFQNEYFVILSILLLFSVFGLSHNTTIFSREFCKKKDRNSFLSGIISGLTISLLSTPCSGPIMGSMIAIAISSKSYILACIIIISIGIGLSLPYLLISIASNPIKIFPKAGNWINYVKIFSWLMLIGTVIWLSFLLLNNEYGLLYLFISLLFGICLFFTMSRSNSVIKIIMFLMIFIAFSFLFATISNTYLNYRLSNLERPKHVEFSEKKIEKYMTNGKTVIVRFTADWCLTCKIMDFYLFNSEEVVNFIRENDIIYMLADVTSKKETEAAKFMSENKINSIPAIYVTSPQNPGGEIYIGITGKDKFIEILSRNL